MKKIIIDELTKDQRIDKFLRRYLPNAGSGFLYRMLREKKIKLNDAKSDGKNILKKGDVITIYFSDETLEKFMGTKEALSEESFSKKDAEGFKRLIIYEDKDVVIINKPAGMLSQKSKDTDVSACEKLISYMICEKQLEPSKLNEYKPSAVNRLDRNTSGILVCAKTLPAARTLSQLFKSRSLKKEYLALVEGRVEDGAHIKGYLKKNSRDNIVEITDEPAAKEDYDKIETAYVPVGHMDGATLLNVDLITGKTHQIRAHLSYMGHPIVGDSKYGDRKKDSALRSRYGIRRQFLHAHELTFPKLAGDLSQLSEMHITAQLPGDLKAVERDIRYVR